MDITKYHAKTYCAVYQRKISPKIAKGRVCPFCKREAGTSLGRGDAFADLQGEAIAASGGLDAAPERLSDTAMKRRLLDSIAQGETKYRSPFTTGRITEGVMGGRAWIDYTSVVLQMAQLEALLDIEELTTDEAKGDEADG